MAVNRKAVFARDLGLCRYCGAPADNIDHVVPKHRWPKVEGVSNGYPYRSRQTGCDSIANLVASCLDCNYYKDNMLIEEAGMELLPIGEWKSPEEAAAIRDAYRIIRPRRARHARLMLKQHGLSQEIGAGRWREMIDEARLAAESPHNLHEGFYPA